jgi:DNA-binding beta-propeller fold protein YncE
MRLSGTSIFRESTAQTRIFRAFAALLLTGFASSAALYAQEGNPSFVVDPLWPQPLPRNWTTGQVGGVCVDSQDHVYIVNRRNLTDKELLNASQAPPIIEFDAQGKMINAFGDPKVVPSSIHGCAVDKHDNVYVAGNHDGIVQKYSPKGELLLQIGTRGRLDTSDGTLTGRALNSSKVSFYMPSSIAIDPENDDIYVADGYGNSRIAVFDKDGKFLRQWGRQGTSAEVEQGVGGAFMQVVHCVSIGTDGLVYVCDRQGDRVEVFDKMGAFKKNIFVRADDAKIPDSWGTVWWVGFSPDPAQKYLYVEDGRNEQIHTLLKESGKIVGSFGRPGHQVGEFDHAHTLAVDSKGNIYVAETDWGERVQKFIPSNARPAQEMPK